MIRHRHLERSSVSRLTLREAHSEVWTRPQAPGAPSRDRL